MRCSNVYYKLLHPQDYAPNPTHAGAPSSGPWIVYVVFYMTLNEYTHKQNVLGTMACFLFSLYLSFPGQCRHHHFVRLFPCALSEVSCGLICQPFLPNITFTYSCLWIFSLWLEVRLYLKFETHVFKQWGESPFIISQFLYPIPSTYYKAQLILDCNRE